MPPHESVFLEVLESARRNESAAWAALVEVYRVEFVRLVAVSLGGRARAKSDPEDVVQDAFLAAFGALDQFRGGTRAEFHGWLRRILASQMARFVRRYYETQARANEAAGPPPDCAGSGTSPSQGAIRREVVARVTAALGRLPEDYRRVLVWREWEGLEVADIAARLGRSENAVRKLLPRALLALKEALIPA